MEGGKGTAKPGRWTPERATAFQEQSVVDRYHLRPPYPQEVIEILAELAVDSPRTVLDVGTGTGELARRLASVVERVDAVDVSAAMMARGKTLPGGDDPRVHWILGAVETVPLDQRYALIVGGSSLHWLDWKVAFARFATLLSPRGAVAVVRRGLVSPPWQEELRALERRYDPEREGPRPDLVAELEQRGLLRVVGRREAGPVALTQSIEEYVGAVHSRSAFSLGRMAPGVAATLDEEVRELVRPWSRDGLLHLQVMGSVVWGQPLSGLPAPCSA
jgi:SAM-dependent methyltransferase